MVEEKKNIYRWHDLEADPSDLPTIPFKRYLCVGSRGATFIAEYLIKNNKPDWYCYNRSSPIVIGWKEIEPFRGVEND